MFKVTARTILELGSELISSDIIAFYELIKNGFDAGSDRGVEISLSIVLSLRAFKEHRHNVARGASDFSTLKSRILQSLNKEAEELFDTAVEQLDDARSKEDLLIALDRIYRSNSITISDTGKGMRLEDLRDVFLVIGTPSRKHEVERALTQKDGSSPFLGEKGIGRLSAMRLGSSLEVVSATEKDTKLNLLDIDWVQFGDLDAMLEDIKISPRKGGPKPSKDWSGTKITIRGLESDWTRRRLEELAVEEFSMITDPLAGRRSRKRVVLLWNGDRIKIPSLDKGFLNEAHASIIGRYEIDGQRPVLTLDMTIRKLGFEHPVITETKVFEGADLYGPIAGKDTGIDAPSLTSVGEFSFEAHWFNRRRIKGTDQYTAAEIKDLHRQWTGVRLYRDGFRVYPYGEEDNDWLNLDRKALMAKGYLLNKIQLVGQVNIGRVTNPELIDQTNREGLRVTPEHDVLLEVVQFSIQTQLREKMRRVESQYKEKREKFEPAKTEVKALEKRARSSIALLRETATEAELETIDELQMTLFQVTEFAQRAQKRIEEVEKDAQQMIDMAGIGLMVEMVAHELARTSEDALDNLNALRSKRVPDDVRARIESLRASMKSISKRLRVLDPLSVSGRQSSETFDLVELVRETLDAHENQFSRHEIDVDLDLGKKPVKVRMVKGMVVQVLENLISNSVYWLDLEKAQRSRFQPSISIGLDPMTSTISFEDNGPGIHESNVEEVFEIFFSLKEAKKRRGLGLYIAQKCAAFNGGKLEIDTDEPNAQGRYSKFLYTVGQ